MVSVVAAGSVVYAAVVSLLSEPLSELSFPQPDIMADVITSAVTAANIFFFINPIPFMFWFVFYQFPVFSILNGFLPLIKLLYTICGDFSTLSPKFYLFLFPPRLPFASLRTAGSAAAFPLLSISKIRTLVLAFQRHGSSGGV